MNASSPHRRQPRVGFTLVELLVVIGIIALLIGILLPTLAKAKETANRAKCLSNLHQIGLAMIMYTNENKGTFPASSRLTNEFAEDFIYWEQPKATWRLPTADGQNTRPGVTAAGGYPADPRTSQQDMDRGALVRYMGGHFNAATWTCPTDDVTVRSNVTSIGGVAVPYPYSYQMNNLLSCELPITNNYTSVNYMKPRAKITQMRHSYEVAMVVEESARTINDGDFQLVDFSNSSAAGYVTMPWLPNTGIYVIAGGNAAAGNVSAGDWLSVRHDSQARNPDNTYIASKDKNLNIPDCAAKGTVVFCDGHADWVTREYVQSPLLRHWDPTW